ncbi:MAG: nucleotidyltransferase domain-containing protein [bacterium]|nr:nucleotidyltransferase domain-containing protein [bacterium]
MRSYKDWSRKTSETGYLLDRIQKIVTSIDPGAQVILYGSRARGDSNIGSDWDFLILSDLTLNRKSILEIRDRLYELELETDTILSSIIRTKKEWGSPKYDILPFKHAVEQEGILL